MTVTSALANVGSKIDGPFVFHAAIILFVMDEGLRNKHVLVDLIYGILGGSSPFSFGLCTLMVAPHPIDSINCGRL